MNLADSLAISRGVSFYRFISVKICLVVFCTVLLPIWSQAQTTVFPEWTARFVGPGSQSIADPTAIVADSQGNSFVTGTVYISTAAGPSLEILTIKYDPDGHQLWKAFVSSPVGRAQPEDIALDAVGNVYVAGALALHGPSNNPTDTEFVTIKYDTNGVRQWIDSLAPPAGGNNFPVKLVVNPQTGVFVTGTAYLPNTQGSQILTIKYDFSGRLQWARQYPPITGASNTAAGMGMDAQENIYVAANSSHTNPMIYKFDVNGNLLKSFSSGETSSIRAFYVDPQGNSYAGGCYSPGPMIAKTNSQGSLAWVHNLTPSSCLGGILTDTNGNVFLSQTLRTNSGATSDISVLKLNSNGVQQWQTQSNGQANGSGKDLAGSLVINSQGNVYVTGDDTISNTETNLVTIKYSPSGQQIWMQLYAKSGQINLARGIAIGGDGGLFVTAESVDVGVVNGNNDWLTIDYVQDAAKLAPASLPFGNQAINTQSAAQSVQLKNTTSAALNITGITIGGDFHQTNNCPSILAAELSCTISVTFTPSALGSRSGTLSVSDPWEGSPQRVTLTGTGVSQ